MGIRQTLLRSAVLAVATLLLFVGGVGSSDSRASQDFSVAITFDDLVGQSTVRTTENYIEISEGILSALQAAGAPATGFVNEIKLYSGGKLVTARVDILRSWLDGGFELGNHTYSHPNLHEVPVDEWLADMD